MTKNQILEMYPVGSPVPDGRRYDPVTAITAGVGVGGSLLGGLFGSSAASKAAKIQADAAQKAGQQVVDTTKAVNPTILAAAKAAGQNVTDAADTAATGVNTATDSANKLLNPYVTAGSTASDVLSKGIAVGGDFNHTPTLADIQIDPGYKFREEQGELALSRGAAARGAVQGGAFAKDINTFASGNASQEFEKAFNRFQQDRQNRFSNVKSVSDSGQVAAGRSGDNTIGSARYGGDITTGAKRYAGDADMNATDLVGSNTINASRAQGDFLTQGANAQAAGKVGSANAWGNAFGGAANSVTGALNLRKILQNPANKFAPFNPAYQNNPLEGTDGTWYAGAGPALPPYSRPL